MIDRASAWVGSYRLNTATHPYGNLLPSGGGLPLNSIGEIAMSIINLTKFRITPELQGFGVQDLSNWKEFQEIRNLLFFQGPPVADLTAKRIERLTEIAVAESQRTGCTKVLMGCPPWMAHGLCAELIYHGLEPLVSFTKRTQESGIQVVDLVKAAA